VLSEAGRAGVGHLVESLDGCVDLRLRGAEDKAEVYAMVRGQAGAVPPADTVSRPDDTEHPPFGSTTTTICEWQQP